MSPAGKLRAHALAGAVLLGVAGDMLLRAPGQPALNASLWALTGAGVLVWLGVRRGGVSRETAVLVAVALGFALALSWRAAPAVQAVNVLAALALVVLAAGRAGLPWLRHAGVAACVGAACRVGLSTGLGGAALLERPALTAGGRTAAVARRGLTVARGAALGLPPVLLFGALLTSADPVFARLISDTFAYDIQRQLDHVLLFTVIAWGSAGYLRAFLLGAPRLPVQVPVLRPRIPPVEAAFALALVNALFLAFVVVQLRYLFGGSGMVEVTPGLTYAEYARRGFFELVAVAALVIPLLLVADWAVETGSGWGRRVFVITAHTQLVLLFVMLGSAVQRMRLYQDAYGLTELRLYTTFFMVWVALMLGWLGLTVLRGRRDRFVSGALVAGLVLAAGLNVLNPHALIARVNAARAAAGEPLDVHYAGVLSADAVPALVAALPALPADAACALSGELLERHSGARVQDWRTWNHAQWRAGRIIAASAGRLRTACNGFAADDVDSGGGRSSSVRQQQRTPARGTVDHAEVPADRTGRGELGGGDGHGEPGGDSADPGTLRGMERSAGAAREAARRREAARW